MPSSERTACSIAKPLRWISGSRSQVKVECSSRTCSSSSTRVHSLATSAPPVAHHASIARLDFVGLERIDDVPQPEDTAGAQHSAHPSQSGALPEVGQMVQRVTRVDEVDMVTLVVVREEPRLDDVDVGDAPIGDLSAERGEHHGRDVDRDNTAARGRDCERELSGARAEIHQGRLGSQPERHELGHLGERTRVFLRVIARHVVGVEVLAARRGELVEQPTSSAVSHAGAASMRVGREHPRRHRAPRRARPGRRAHRRSPPRASSLRRTRRSPTRS